MKNKPFSNIGSESKQIKKPVITCEWETIIDKQLLDSPDFDCGQVVDHCFFRDSNQNWQAWVQIRDTRYGRVFTRWEQTGDFQDSSWTPHGICWRADKSVGESTETPVSEDVIQAPYVLEDDSAYIMVYGGGPVDPDDITRQICMARSHDGISFTRENNNGLSRVAVGPNHAADAFILKHNDEYLLYVGTQYFETNRAKAAVTLRRSKDLKNWTEPEVVHAGGICGKHTHSSQSIFVCVIEDIFYLFKMGWSGDQETAVYYSETPNGFGDGDQNLVTVLNASAAEIIRDGERWYISSLTIPSYNGVKVAELKWVDSSLPE